jgi:hypothetical protein
VNRFTLEHLAKIVAQTNTRGKEENPSLVPTIVPTAA